MNDLAVLIGLISFPGLIATLLCDKLLVHSERWNSFIYGTYTFIFGVGSYVVLQIVVWLLAAIDRHVPFISARSALALWATLASSKPLDFTEIAWATALAPAIAIGSVYAANKKFIHRFGQKAGISNKYGDENLFSYFLNADDIVWVYVRDPGIGLSYRGMIRSFAESKAIQELVLVNVTVYDYGDSTELYQVDSIYLSKPHGSFIIEAPLTERKGEPNDRQEDSLERGHGARSSQGRSQSRNRNKAGTTAAAPTSAEEKVTKGAI